MRYATTMRGEGRFAVGPAAVLAGKVLGPGNRSWRHKRLTTPSAAPPPHCVVCCVHCDVKVTDYVMKSNEARLQSALPPFPDDLGLNLTLIFSISQFVDSKMLRSAYKICFLLWWSNMLLVFTLLFNHTHMYIHQCIDMYKRAHISGTAASSHHETRKAPNLSESLVSNLLGGWRQKNR